MAGNSQRRGAVRKGGQGGKGPGGNSGKGPTVGSGGQRRRGLAGKGPTPKASERGWHPAARRAQDPAGRRAQDPVARPVRRGPPRPGARKPKASSEVVAGRNSVVEALRAGVPVTTMYVATRIDTDDRVREALGVARERGIPVLEAPRGELDRLTDGAVHQGLAVQVPPYEYAPLRAVLDPQAPGIPLLVVLDGVTDPRNLGAVIRSVAAFGGHGVVLPERRSAGLTASAWKSSAGAAARIPVAKVTNLTRALEELKKAGFFVIGLDMGGDVRLPGLELGTGPVALVVGSEGKGLSRLVRETCDQVVAIPMSSAVESLNAGLAAGIALYEIARQREHPG